MIPEPFNSILLVVLGALLGAVAAGSWCGCLPRWRWRRSWRRLVERNGGEWCEAQPACGHTARFLAESARRRTESRAVRLKEVAK